MNHGGAVNCPRVVCQPCPAGKETVQDVSGKDPAVYADGDSPPAHAAAVFPQGTGPRRGL